MRTFPAHNIPLLFITLLVVAGFQSNFVMRTEGMRYPGGVTASSQDLIFEKGFGRTLLMQDREDGQEASSAKERFDKVQDDDYDDDYPAPFLGPAIAMEPGLN